MSGPLRNGFYNLLIALHLESHATSRLVHMLLNQKIMIWKYYKLKISVLSFELKQMIISIIPYGQIKKIQSLKLLECNWNLSLPMSQSATWPPLLPCLESPPPIYSGSVMFDVFLKFW